MKQVAASFFDGHSSRRQSALLQFAADEVKASGEFGVCSAAPSALQISEPLGRSPRQVRFPGGRIFEVADLDGLAACLAISGIQEPAVVRLQARWSYALAALLLTVCVLLGAYFWGLPAFSDYAAGRLPTKVVDALSRQTLSLLDKQFLRPSKQSTARQEELEKLSLAVLQKDGLPAFRLHFRSAFGPANAFALPNGDIVIYDELMDLAESDEEIVAVLAHELGHVALRHGLRQMIRSSMVSFVVGSYLGDVSSLATGMASLLLMSNYSRKFELEADAFAGKLLLESGRSPALLVSILQRIEKKSAPSSRQDTGLGIFSSHPELAERSSRLKGMSR